MSGGRSRPVVERSLECGATVLVAPDPSLGVLSVHAAATGGLLAETPASNGVGHLLGKMLLRGSGSRCGHEVAETIDHLAARCQAIAGRNSLGLNAVMMQEVCDQGLALWASCLLEPHLSADELEVERALQLQGIAGQRDSRPTRCLAEMVAALWHEHPYRMRVLGHPASVASLDRDALIGAYRRTLDPRRLTIAAVGAVDPPRLLDWLDARLSAAARPEVAPCPPPPLEAAPAEPREVHVPLPGGQTHVAIGFRAVAIDDERRFALAVLCRVLGGQSGRLFRSLRERDGLVYSATASCVEGIHPGYLMAYFACAPAHVDRARDVVMTELRRLREGELEPEELERARRGLVGTHRIRMQRRAARAISMAVNHAYGLGHDEYLRVPQGLAAVTRERLVEVACELLHLERPTVAIVGPYTRS